MKVCIVEDDKLLLDNLCLLLRGEPGVEVVGGFLNAEDALAALARSELEVLLADIDLPGMSGVELIRQVKELRPAVNCMAFTIFEDRATVFAAIKAGACGYLLKGASPRTLVESLRELYEGGAPMTPKIARKVVLDIQQDGKVPETPLSDREVDILREIERGLSYKEIAAALHISPHTVHTHIKNIYEKIQARSRAEALRKARSFGAI